MGGIVLIFISGGVDVVKFLFVLFWFIYICLLLNIGKFLYFICFGYENLYCFIKGV